MQQLCHTLYGSDSTSSNGGELKSYVCKNAQQGGAAQVEGIFLQWREISFKGL